MSEGGASGGASPQAPEPVTGFVDIHCHVLPGIDDGAEDIEQSLAFLRTAAANGTSAIIATPHQHPLRYPNQPSTLRVAHERLLLAMEEARARGERLPDVALGAEVHLDEGLPRLIEAGERLRLAGGQYLLFELPDTFPLRAVEQVVFDLQVLGITPVLAHPERIPQFLRQPAQLRRLVEQGALGQATGSSVAGVFGAPCREITLAFIREGLIHVVASDAHDERRRTTSLREACDALRSEFGDALASALLVERPRAILEGRDVDVEPQATAPADMPESGAMALLRRLFRG